MKRQNNTSQTKGVARALVPFTQKINEINNINFSSIDFFFAFMLLCFSFSFYASIEAL